MLPENALNLLDLPHDTSRSIPTEKDGLGHIMRNDKYQVLQLVIEGRELRKRGPGPSISWLMNIRQWTDQASLQLFRITLDRIKWAVMIPNVLRGYKAWRRN